MDKEKNRRDENSKHARGRPSTFSPEIAAIICERLAEGESLRKITSDSDMPSMYTVYYWIGQQAEFANQYAHARADQADTLADEILHIADTDPDASKARVRVDARKWVASKLKPKKYGDFKHLDIDVNNNLQTMPMPQLLALKAEKEAEVIRRYKAGELPDPDVVDGEVVEDATETDSESDDQSEGQ